MGLIPRELAYLKCTMLDKSIRWMHRCYFSIFRCLFYNMGESKRFTLKQRLGGWAVFQQLGNTLATTCNTLATTYNTPAPREQPLHFYFDFQEKQRHLTVSEGHDPYMIDRCHPSVFGVYLSLFVCQTLALTEGSAGSGRGGTDVLIAFVSV